MTSTIKEAVKAAMDEWLVENPNPTVEMVEAWVDQVQTLADEAYGEWLDDHGLQLHD